MSNVLIFDLESNGLLDKADRLWVSSFYTEETGITVATLTDAPLITQTLHNYGTAGDIIVGHNILDYDLPLLKKLYGFEYHGKVLDTLVLSRLLNPKRIGGHGLAAWGERFGVPKPPIEDWTQWSDKMPNRCKEDVRINKLTLEWLLKEGGLTIEEAYITI